MRFRDFLMEVDPAARIKAFKQLGYDQRFRPEEAMRAFQKVQGGGVVPYLAEHVGDLTHRMSHDVEFEDYGFVYVREKTEGALRSIGDGVERVNRDNITRNAEHGGHDLAKYQADIDKALLLYAREHAKLRVYNEPQALAREAAVQLGKQDWRAVEKALRKLQKLYKRGEEAWNVEASKFNPNYK